MTLTIEDKDDVKGVKKMCQMPQKGEKTAVE